MIKMLSIAPDMGFIGNLRYAANCADMAEKEERAKDFTRDYNRRESEKMAGILQSLAEDHRQHDSRLIQPEIHHTTLMPPTLTLTARADTPLFGTGDGSCRVPPIITPTRVEAFPMPASRQYSTTVEPPRMLGMSHEGSCRATPIISNTYVNAFPMPASGNRYM